MEVGVTAAAEEEGEAATLLAAHSALVDAVAEALIGERLKDFVWLRETGAGDGVIEHCCCIPACIPFAWAPLPLLPPIVPLLDPDALPLDDDDALPDGELLAVIKGSAAIDEEEEGEELGEAEGVLLPL